MSLPTVNQSRTWIRIGWLLSFVLGCLLSHDFYYGDSNLWLPFLSGGGRLFGPMLACLALVAYFVELVRGRSGTPRSARTISIISWVVRIMGILMIAAPWLMGLYVSLTRAPGVRPGNEGEGLFFTAFLLLLSPPGLALTVFSFFIRDKGTKPGTQAQAEPRV